MYASNKRTRASKGVDEMRKVLDELENKPPLVEGKTLGILVFLRNQLRRIGKFQCGVRHTREWFDCITQFMRLVGR
ncbi:hypothetical protein PC116_g16305 [Phytophthora cactorum]|nr:hypothetical protein PC116_g16305 [Phytophthora cactorum]